MAGISSQNGRMLVDYTARDYAALLQSLRAQVPLLLPEWQDYQSEADFGNVLLELFAHMTDVLNFYVDRTAAESFLATAQTRASIIQHLNLIGYVLATAAPAAASLTLSVPAGFSGTLKINQGDAFASKSGKNTPSLRFEFVQASSLEIDFATIRPAADQRKHYPGILVEEGRLIREEVLGVSNELPNQQFALAHAQPILQTQGNDTGQKLPGRDMVVTTRLGGDIQGWTRRDTLAFSRNNQRDYVVKVDEEDRAVLHFGDGAFGAIPPRGAEIRVTYRVGGGAVGNVPAHAIQTILSAPDLVNAGARVTNPAPASGGADRESIEHAIRLAPSVFRAMRRAVTREDYEAIALNFPGVGKVRAEATHWNKVVLYVAPAGGGFVSDLLRQKLHAHFEDKRPVTVLMEIANVQYVNIYVTAEIGVLPYYDPQAVKAECERAGAALLEFARVKFNDTLYLSKFYEALEAVEGVDFVTISEFRRTGDSEIIAKDGKITTDVDELPRAPLVADPDPDPDPNQPAPPVYTAGVQILINEGS